MGVVRQRPRELFFLAPDKEAFNICGFLQRSNHLFAGGGPTDCAGLYAVECSLKIAGKIIRELEVLARRGVREAQAI